MHTGGPLIVHGMALIARVMRAPFAQDVLREFGPVFCMSVFFEKGIYL